MAHVRARKQKHMPVKTRKDISQSDQVQSGNVEIPPDRYQARIVGCTAGESKAGNPMLSFDMELVASAPLEVGGKKYDINGQKFTLYQPYATDAQLDRLFELNEKLGLPAEINTESPNTKQYEGIVVDIVLKSTKQVRRKAPTEAQRKANQPGDPIKDAQGKEIHGGYRIEAFPSDILGKVGGAALANAQAAAAKRPY